MKVGKSVQHQNDLSIQCVSNMIKFITMNTIKSAV